MRVLVDTHVVLWWGRNSSLLPSAWREAMTDPGNEIVVSAVTAWEVEIKRRSGKLDFPTTAIAVATQAGFTLLGVSAQEATLAGSLDWDHKDPFDRLLAAQAIENRLTLMTQDDALRAAPGVRAF